MPRPSQLQGCPDDPSNDPIATEKLANAEKATCPGLEKAKQDAEFNRLIAEGDANVKQTKYAEGISSYKSALKHPSGDAGVLAKIAAAEKLLAQALERQSRMQSLTV